MTINNVHDLLKHFLSLVPLPIIQRPCNAYKISKDFHCYSDSHSIGLVTNYFIIIKFNIYIQSCGPSFLRLLNLAFEQKKLPTPGLHKLAVHCTYFIVFCILTSKFT